MASAKPSNVAHVILGILDGDDAVPMSGYDIKQLIDKSARFFFAANVLIFFWPLQQPRTSPVH